MNGFIKRATAVTCLGGGLALSWGCECYHDLVDPCYPARYSAMARESVNETFAAQAYNGHVLDQTVWNYDFEKGTDKLTVMGETHLAYLARRRPAPDPKVFLQTAQDVVYDPANSGEFAKARAKLDSDRIQAVLNFLQAETAGRPMAFDVTIHDPAETGMAAQRMMQTPQPGTGAVIDMQKGYKGILPLAGGASGGSGGSK